jgi:hypothetical protein
MAMAEIDDGSLRIRLPEGQTIAGVVDVVFDLQRRSASFEEMMSTLMALGLSERDAEISIDRVQGGAVRAATRNLANDPGRDWDPVAHESFNRFLANPRLLYEIYPDMMREIEQAGRARKAQEREHRAARPWWKFWAD